MELILLRHAKTNQTSPTGRDFDRELLPKGMAQSKALKAFFEKKNIQPDVVLCSTAKRTRQTLQPLLEIENFPQASFHDELYLSDKSDYRELIEKQDPAECVLLIGHNFCISDLASYLLNDHIILKTSSLVRLNFDGESWKLLSANSCDLVEYFRPSV